MEIKAKNNGCPEGCICDQFGYLPHSVVYMNRSDITELYEIALVMNITLKT